MHKLYFILFSFFLISTQVEAQKLEKFSSHPTEFYKELETFMTLSKRKVMEKAVKDFGGHFQTKFTPKQQDTIIATCNKMLELKMAASPYFKNYLTAVSQIHNLANGQERFSEWHEITYLLFEEYGGKKKKIVNNFFEISSNFFIHRALKFSSTGGVNWNAATDSIQIGHDNKQPTFTFNRLNLYANRGKDSLLIENTSGVFYLLEEIWKGKSGRVGWERHDLDRDHYAQLKTYEIDVTKTGYNAKDAILHLPSFLKDDAITGVFQDKIVSGSFKSYPRFVSTTGIKEIKGIGEGIRFFGQFALEGVNVIGTGTEEEQARVFIKNKKGEVKIRGHADVFIIKKGEVITGEQVDLSIYLQKDSIYHPSINFRYDIKDREIELARGDGSKGRRAFSSSFHQIDIDANKMKWYFDKDSLVIDEEGKAIGSEVERRLHYESKNYYSPKLYRKIQGVGVVNPITTLKVFSEMEGSRTVDANLFAKRMNPKYTIKKISPLLFDLESKGFLKYDPEGELIEVYDKTFLYSDASRDKVDYDNLNIISETNKTSGYLNTKTNELEINGIKFIEFSATQQVATKTDSQKVVMHENRNIDFSGKVFGSLGLFYGKAFHFDYEKFQIRMDSIDVLELFETGEQTDDKGNPVPKAIASRLENLSGVLLIDAPKNKSGKEDIDIFPSFQSGSTSYVYYDNPDHLDSTYNKQDFHFEIDDFALNSLDKLERDDMKFKGTLKSAGIFPDIKETLVVQDDESLGFITQTPANGYPIYGGRGNYQGEIQLNNGGFTGIGKMNYLSLDIEAEDFVFRPKLLTASADEFNLLEDRVKQIPQITGNDIKFALNPYADSLEIRTAGDPFKFYKEGQFDFSGTVVLTPEGVRGEGKLDWDKAIVNSKYFAFGSYSAQSDTMGINIKAADSEQYAISTSNLSGNLDFDKQEGYFKSNSDSTFIDLPYNQFSTSMSQFTWAIEEESIVFAGNNELADFVSINPNQDSLHFNGRAAFYDIKESKLNISGVPFIQSCDAFIYPEKGLVFINQGGSIESFENAQIVADTANQNHVINRANVTIKGKKEYSADGYYEYNIGPHQQEIFLSDIKGSRVGKGKRSEKPTETRAKGVITPEENFYIDHKTQFRGDIALQASNVNLQFKGYSKFDAPKMGNPEWFTIDSEGDKNDLTIAFEAPRNYAGDKLYTGFYLSKENTRIYPRVFMPLYFRKDRPVLPVTGVFKYDEEKDEFIFGDSTKVIANRPIGKKLVFSNKTGKVTGEGLLNICSELDYIKVKAAGKIETEFPDQVDSTNMDPLVIADMMAAIEMIIPEQCYRMLINDIQSSSFDAKDIIYTLKEPFHTANLAEFIPDTNKLAQTIELIKTRTLAFPKGHQKSSFLFTDLPMKWDPDYQSFVSRKALAGLAGINGTMLNKEIECYVEFKMPSNGDDRVYLYFKSPSGYFYFFSYKGGVMGSVSDNTRFNDILRGLKSKEAIKKMPDGGQYEIQNLEPNTAQRFLARARAAIEGGN